MPELPEVETVRRALAAELPGSTLERVAIRRADLRWPIPVRRVRALRGQRLERVDRRAKYLVLQFDRAASWGLLLHLGMSGRVLLAEGAPRWAPHEHWRLRFGDRLLRYVDPRRFGSLLVVDSARPETHPLLAELGPEPLSDALDGNELARRSRGRRTMLKSFLLDSRNVAGIGNIYACEACFEAGLRPTLRVDRLSRAAWQRVHAALRSVLQRALAAGGTTLRDYRSADGEPGWFQVALWVYGRAGEPCRRCGAAIRSVSIGGRSTFYCPTCQRR